jgi:myosin heavy subunit
MEDKKLYELKFELKEIAGLPPGNSSCTLEVADYKDSIICKGQLLISLMDISGSTPLVITVMLNDEAQGMTKVSLGTLFGESLIRKVDRWFKIKSEAFDALKIRVNATLIKAERIKAKTVQTTRRSSKGPKELKCPYMEKLASGKETNTEPLNDVWKFRESGQHYQIKISLEPDSPGRDSDVVVLGGNNPEDVAIEALHNMSGPHLKQVVRRLCEEVKKLSAISDKIPMYREEMYKKIAERKSLETSALREMESIKENLTKKHEKLFQLQEGRKSFKDALIDRQDQSRKLEGELDLLKATLGDLKRENIILSAQKLQFDDCRKVLAELEKVNSESNKRKIELQEKIDKSQSELSEGHTKAVRDIEMIKKERDETKAKIEEASKDLKHTTDQNEKLRKTISNVKSKLNDLQEVKSQARQATLAFQQESLKREEITSKLDQLTTDLEKTSKESFDKQQELILSKRSSILKTSQIDSSLEKKEQEILELRKNLLKETCSKIAQEQICCVRADLDQLICDIQKLEKNHEETRGKILKDLEVGSKILLEESSKVYASAERLDHMIDAIDKKGEEIDGLKRSMSQVKEKNMVYVALRDDPVDVALADYLAVQEPPVPIKFNRQGGGNYLFGTKKIYIKFENGKLLVRVGGGFTGIDEFLKIYTPVELEKKDSPDASPRFSSISKSSRDSSPSSVIGRLSWNEASRSPRK